MFFKDVDAFIRIVESIDSDVSVSRLAGKVYVEIESREYKGDTMLFIFDAETGQLEELE